MRTNLTAALLVLIGIAMSACAGMPSSLLTTGSIQTKIKDHPVRGTPAVAGRPARVYVMVGFKEKDCLAIAPEIQIIKQPTKGAVSFHPNQMTTVQFSGSGKCMGKKLAGTGIYYTARNGESGADSFTISASTASGQVATRTFNVRVVD